MEDQEIYYREKRGFSGLTKLIAGIVIAAILIGGGIVFGPRLLHTCDNCDSFFIGTGYRANIISNALSAISGNDDKILCRECAEKNHAIGILTGSSLEDYRIPLFGEEGD